MLLVREDTFDWKLGQFRVLYVEHPRKTGFKWIDLGYKKPRPAVRRLQDDAPLLSAAE